MDLRADNVEVSRILITFVCICAVGATWWRVIQLVVRWWKRAHNNTTSNLLNQNCYSWLLIIVDIFMKHSQLKLRLHHKEFVLSNCFFQVIHINKFTKPKWVGATVQEEGLIKWLSKLKLINFVYWSRGIHFVWTQIPRKKELKYGNRSYKSLASYGGTCLITNKMWKN